MANGDVTVQVKVSGTLSGGDAIRTFDESKTYSSIATVFDRVITLPATGTVVDLLAIGTNAAGATLTAWNCLIVYNMDTTNAVRIGLKDTGADTAYVRLNAGEHFVLERDQLDVNTTGAAYGAYNSIDTVTAESIAGTPTLQVVAF